MGSTESLMSTALNVQYSVGQEAELAIVLQDAIKAETGVSKFLVHILLKYGENKEKCTQFESFLRNDQILVKSI